MSGRRWDINRAREMRHSRGSVRWNVNEPVMAPLLARNTSRPAASSKDDMRAETERLLAEFNDRARRD
jgi:hypothetical protein